MIFFITLFRYFTIVLFFTLHFFSFSQGMQTRERAHCARSVFPFIKKKKKKKKFLFILGNLAFYWQFKCLSLPTQPAYSPLSLSSSDAVSKQCQSAYSGCSFLVRDLALGVRAAAHLLWWLLFSLL